MTPSSRGLGHRPFTAVTGVRIPVGSPIKYTALCGVFYCPNPLDLNPTGGRGDSPRKQVSHRGHRQSMGQSRFFKINISS